MHLRERELGDMIQEALSFVGITQERVSKWLGRPCNCQERVQKLNLISIWAKGYSLAKLTMLKSI